MTKTILIATVAALAITAPAQAERGGKDKDRGGEAQAQQAQPQKAQRGGGEQRVRAERPQRQERVRTERPQRQERVRMERPQRQERVRMERPQREQRVRMERPQREQRVRFDRPQREQRVRMERPQREQRVRQERSRIERVAKNHNRFERRSAIERQQPRRTERFAEKQQRQQFRQAERLAKFQNRSDRRIEKQDFRQALRSERNEQRSARKLAAAIGQRLDTRQDSRDWYDDYAGQRYQSFTNATPGHSYNYDDDDGYLYQVRRDNNLVTALYPLLGGAFSSGRVMPIGYQDYNVPYAYRDLYYDTPDYSYRYGDGGIYRVDSDTQMIQAVVALLTGQNLGVGQMLPMGYDVYNVPYAYRDTYYDTNDAWYRYDDGYIYQVDPYSRMIQGMYPVSYGNYAVGYQVPAYANYGGYGAYGGGYPSYSVPYGYQSLYNGAPGYNYQYANGGIYQVDPKTQLISALVALVTGTNLGVGQMLPTGYDAYNVPQAYRSTYFDTNDAWYRYDDGTIYQVDPYSRMIETAIPVSYGGYQAGYPVPAGYPGYDVPDYYSGLYNDAPGYDYRYFDGGIYQIEPDTRVVVAPVALVTGNTFGVGQALPAGYDVYNVPYAYRDRYYDSDRYMYRYADGNIYQVDPTTRLINAVIDAIV